MSVFRSFPVVLATLYRRPTELSIFHFSSYVLFFQISEDLVIMFVICHRKSDFVWYNRIMKNSNNQ